MSKNPKLSYHIDYYDLESRAFSNVEKSKIPHYDQFKIQEYKNYRFDNNIFNNTYYNAIEKSKSLSQTHDIEQIVDRKYQQPPLIYNPSSNSTPSIINQNLMDIYGLDKKSEVSNKNSCCSWLSKYFQKIFDYNVLYDTSKSTDNEKLLENDQMPKSEEKPCVGTGSSYVLDMVDSGNLI